MLVRSSGEATILVYARVAGGSCALETDGCNQGTKGDKEDP